MDFYKDFECIIFDLDGTLIDSIGIWREIDIKFMKKRNLPIPDDFYDKVSSLNLKQAADYVINSCGVTDPPDAVINEWLTMAENEYANNIEMISGAAQFLKKLKESDVKICLATASHKNLYKPCLTRHGVYDLFDVIVTTDEVKRKKGFPDVYLLAAQKAGADPSRCCVFEDIYLGIVGAKAAEMTCVGVIEEHSKENRADIERLADMTIRDYNEIL